MVARTSDEAWTSDLAAFLEPLSPGCILLFKTANPIGEISAFFDRTDYNHCGIYLGGGRFIHATFPISEGGNCIRIEELDRFCKAAKVARAAAADLDERHRAPMLARARAMEAEGARFAFDDVLLVPAIVDAAKTGGAQTGEAPVGAGRTLSQTDLELVLLRHLDVEDRASLTCSEFVARALPRELSARIRPQIRDVDPFEAGDDGIYDRQMAELRADLDRLELTDGWEPYAEIYEHVTRWGTGILADVRVHQRLAVEVFGWAITVALAAAGPVEDHGAILDRIDDDETLDVTLNLVSPGDLERAPFLDVRSLRYRILSPERDRPDGAEIELVASALTGSEALTGSGFGVRLIHRLREALADHPSTDEVGSSSVELRLRALVDAHADVGELVIALANELRSMAD